MVKNPPANAGDEGDVGLIPGLGRSPGGENGNPLRIFAWKIQWTEEPGRLQSMGLQRVGHKWAHHTVAAFHRTTGLDFQKIKIIFRRTGGLFYR